VGEIISERVARRRKRREVDVELRRCDGWRGRKEEQSQTPNQRRRGGEQDDCAVAVPKSNPFLNFSVSKDI
jgi:hypothetical protein